MTSRTIETRSATVELDGGTVTKRYRLGNEHLYRNDCAWLRSMASMAFVPTVYACDDKSLSVTMSYCGEPVSSANAPPDWDRQIEDVVSALEAADCHHGDLLPQNILVHEGRLHIVDFATAAARHDPSPRKKRTFSDAHARTRLRHLLHGFPPGSEVHAFVVWSARNAAAAEAEIGSKLEIIDRVLFSPLHYKDYAPDRKTWLKRFYDTPHLQGSPKGKEPFTAFVVLSRKPEYRPRKRVFSSENRIVNTEVFDLKCALREGREGYLHSSDNQEEARRNLRWLSYDDASLPYRYVAAARPQFRSIGDVFEMLNGLPRTRYVVLRRPALDTLSGAEDYDILCDDYFAVKRALGGVAYKTRSTRLFQNVGATVDDGGFKVANHVSIANRKVSFDIRYIGDGYYPRAWQERMLQNRVLDQGAYVCAPEDAFYGKAYHALFHKARLPKKYADYFATQLGISDPQQIEATLRRLTLEYLRTNGFTPTRPKDVTIPHNPPVKAEVTRWRELYLADREMRAGNYSGASKVLLNYVKVHGDYVVGGRWIARILYRRAKADTMDFLTDFGEGSRRRLTRLMRRPSPVSLAPGRTAGLAAKDNG